MIFDAGLFFMQLLGLLIVSLLLVYIYVKNVTYNYWKSRGIVEEEAVVPFGSLLRLITEKISIGEFFRDVYLCHKNQPAIGIYVVDKPVLLIRDPELIRCVLTKNFANFHDRATYLNERQEPLTGTLAQIKGNKWKHLRAKLTPAFTGGKIKLTFDAIARCGERLADVVADDARRGAFVEIKEIVTRFTTDVFISTAFGIQCDSLTNPNTDIRKWGRRMFRPKSRFGILAGLFPSILRILSYLRIGIVERELSDSFVGLFDEIIELRSTSNEERRDFLQLIVRLMSEDEVKLESSGHISEQPEGYITRLEGAAQAFAFWLAGFEPAASVITHCLYELCQNKNIENKLIEEIDEVLEKYKGITYESLNEMSYLKNIISETLRKHPSNSNLNRICTEDVILPGINLRVEKGTPIIIPTMGLHWDPEFYPEPQKFDPERFNEENIAKRHNYAYLPFGEGPRNCVGRKLGEIQVKIALVNLLSKYQFSPGPNFKVPFDTEIGGIVHGPKGGLVLRIQQRS